MSDKLYQSTQNAKNSTEEKAMGQNAARNFVITAEEIEREPLGKIGADRLKLARLRMSGELSSKEAKKKERALDRLENRLIEEGRKKTLASVPAKRQHGTKSSRRKPAVSISGTGPPYPRH